MKWLDNITSIINTHSAGKCPYCGSKNTDYRAVEISHGNGYGDVWCNDCRKAFHISRMSISQEIVREIKLPESLDY